MKKLICILLSLSIFVSLMILPITVFAESTNSYNPINLKINKAQQLKDLYGENLLSDAEDTVSWNFEDLEAIVSLKESNISIDDSVIEIRWGNKQDPDVTAKNHPYGTHGYIIKKANDSSEISNKVSERYITLVYEISKKCDTEYGSSCGNDFCSAYHGNGNCIANVAYLWRLTRLIGANKTSLTNETDANIKSFINQMADTAYNNIPKNNLSNDAQEKLNGIHTITPKVLKKYYKTTSIASYSGQTWAGRCKYILYGIISHLVGDVYAHRVLLKSNATYYLEDPNTTFNASTMLDRALFKQTYFKVDDLINDVTNGNVAIAQLKNYVREDLDKDTMEKKIELVNKNYPDAPTFYPKRISESICALSFFFDTYKDVSSISEIIDYADACLTPVEGFKIRNFTAYENQLGLYYI